MKRADNFDELLTQSKNDFSKMDFSKQVELVLNGADTTNSHLLVMQTPEILKKAGLPDLPILITAKHVKTITQSSGKSKANYHGIDAKIIKDIPKYIADPVMIADSLTRKDSIVVVTDALDSSKNPIIAAIKLNGRGEINNCYIDANILTSAYGKDNFKIFLKNIVLSNGLIYWNKEKSQRLSVNLGLQLPDIMTSLRSDSIIHRTEAFVNISNKKISSYTRSVVIKETKMTEGIKTKHKEELREHLKSRVTEAVEAYRKDPSLIAEYLCFAAKFNRYSHNNIRLIWAQNHHASYVVSAAAFKLGIPDQNGVPLTDEKIFIKKGERALYIWSPTERLLVKNPESGEFEQFSHLTKKQREAALAEKWERKKDCYFILVPVFDISQTTASPELYPRVFGFGGNENRNADLQFAAIKNYAENVLCCPVDICDFGKQKISVRGKFIPSENRILISDMLSGDGKLSTLIHEVGHAELHQRLFIDKQNKSSAQVELEADMYSLMIESRLGISPTPARCSHLSSCYEEYIREVKGALKEGEALDLGSDSPAFTSVIERYQRQAPIIDEYLKRQKSINAQYAAQEVAQEQITAAAQNAPQNEDFKSYGVSV